MSKNYIDFNNSANDVIQWLWESEESRRAYACLMHRVDLSMEGKPYRNLYQEELTSNIKKLAKEEQEAAKGAGCTCVKEGSSYILRKAVMNRANQMSGGVETYEYQVFDPYMIIDDDTEDLLAAKCEQDYIQNRLEEMSATFSRDLSKYGMTAVIVKYDQECDKNTIERINPKNVWFDTMYSATGRERFRGYSVMISWNKLKKIIEHDRDEINYELEVPDKSILNKNGMLDKHIKVGRKKITTLNDLDIYINDLNKIATSPSLQAPLVDFYEYDQSLRSCYNLGYYKTFATDAKAKTNSGYEGQDVELTVVYDLTRKIEYKVLNRKYVISANHNAFCRKVAFRIYDPIMDDFRVRVDDFCLDCPLKFQFEEWEAKDRTCFPVSPVMTYLDVHDELCAWRSKRDHVSKILSILRIETNGGDASSLRKTLNIMGVILDDIQGDINSINFQYDYSPIDSQIEYLEKTIMEGMSAYDQFDALQSMGDRASAAESGMAIGAIAQGLATHQNAIMALYADIARQCIGNRVVYSSQSEFSVNNEGGYSSITIQQMALDAVINVKPKLARQAHERTLAANALSLLGTMRDGLSENAVSYLIRQALFENVPRKLASTFVKQSGPSKEEVALATQQAQNQAEMLKQNQAAYERNPIPYEVENTMNTMSPDQIDQVIGGLNQASSEMEQPNFAELDSEAMTQTDQGAFAGNLGGLTPESGSELANQNAFGEM